MAIVFAFAAASMWGISTYVAALTTRRASAMHLTFWSQLTGLLVCLPITIGLEGQPGAGSVVPGTVAGLGSGGALVLLYAAVRHTAAGVASSVSAVIACVLPIAYSVVLGSRPSGSVFLGVLVAVVAVGFVTLASTGGVADAGGASHAAMATGRYLPPSGLHGIGLALASASGIGMALYYVALAQVTSGERFWPITEARIGAVALVGLLCLSSQTSLSLTKDSFWSAMVVGVTGMAGAAFYILALSGSLLAVAVAIASLSPVVTVLLGWLLLREYLSRGQFAGLLLAAVGVVLIVSG